MMRSAILWLAVLLALLTGCAREAAYTSAPTTRVPSVTPRPTQEPPATGTARPTAFPSYTSTRIPHGDGDRRQHTYASAPADCDSSPDADALSNQHCIPADCDSSPDVDAPPNQH
jgi:hypothetical protein